jgi:hypothetical protein
VKLWRVIAGVLAVGFAAAGVTPAWACACGGYLPDAQSAARAYGENALVQYSDGTEQITLSMSVHGVSKKAAWIMPVPAAAKVDLGDQDLFYRLDQLTRPKRVVKKTYWPFRDLGIMGSGRGDSAGAPAPPASTGRAVPRSRTGCARTGTSYRRRWPRTSRRT